MRRAWAVLLLSGCGVTFPSESKIEDLRILELRVDPPEVRVFEEVTLDADLDHLASLTPRFAPVRLSAVVAHPDLDATFDIDWIRCRGDSHAGFERVPCSGEQKERIGTGTSTVVRPIQLLLGDLLASSSGSGDAFAALAGDPLDLFTGLRLYLNAQATVASAAIDVDTQRLEGTKRLIVFDPTIVALVLREARRLGPGGLPVVAGVQLPTLCTNVSEEAFGRILEYLATRAPNRAPTYRTLEYLPPTGTETVAWAPGDPPIEVGPNQQILFLPSAADGDKENYRVIDDKCALIDFTETLAWSWFSNVGEISDGITSDGKSTTIGDRETRWRAPSADDLEQEETRVRVWSVLRDGRGGSDSIVVDLVIRKTG